MNNNLKEIFDEYSIQIPNIILPHQIATLDYLLKTCYDEKKNVLIFHKMGSGKTLLGIFFSLIVSNTNKVIIIVPSYNIQVMWENEMKKAFMLLPISEYNLNNIEIITENKFFESINLLEQDLINKIQIYNNSFFLIEEAHHLFDSKNNENILKLKKNLNVIFLLLSGSPIINTVSTVINMLEILTDNLNFNQILYGVKVYETKITKEGEKILKDNLKGIISYYEFDKKLVLPDVYLEGYRLFIYPVIKCPMSELQIKYYKQIREKIKYNEMFNKIMLNASFAVLGDYNNYLEFESLLNDKKQLLDDLYLENGLLHGKQLETLDFSSKLKYFKKRFIDNINTRKKFVYFTNSTIGSVVLRSILYVNGITEYNKTPLPNYRCVFCNQNRSCIKCKPARFLLITSNENINVQEVLNIFNSPNNKNGEEILYLFGSKMMSEGYTLKEVLDIIFLTIPETETEFKQVISRSIRQYSHEDIKSVKIVIYLLIASLPEDEPLLNMNLESNKKSKQTKVNFDSILSNKKYTLKSGFNSLDVKKIDKIIFSLNENLGYDIKKLLYLELKSYNSNIIINIFKESNINTTFPIHNKLIKLVFNEYIKRYFYNNFYLTDLSIFNRLKINNIDILLENVIKTGLVIYNKDFKKSIIIKYNDKVMIIPFKLKQQPYFMFLQLNEFSDVL